ncbi:MAG TPA: hydantoinase B/oxoprolinase family protein [Burkholderiales bacterium]|nr:hydantoinase B/oxoprolinase family protein [Burkholderiales bacterium]
MNPIDLEIHWNRLIAIVDEAGAALKRTSFSTVVRESNDFAVVLLDQDGRLLAQSSWSVPGFIGTAPRSLRGMLSVIPREGLRPGDILFTNDPWIGTGHLPDSTMAAPVFSGERIVAFVVAVAHLSDVGGRQWSADAAELYEEGVRFPVVKLVEEGRFNALVLALLEANVRLPEQVRGDINAQIVAIRVVQRRLAEMLAEYRLPDIDAIAQAIYRASRDAALREIRRIPPGVYSGSVEADGWDEPIRIMTRVDVSADAIRVDYAGTSAQVGYGVNETFNHTYAYTLYPFKCMLSPAVPNNEGFTGLFEVHAPTGSIVNAKPPAAVGARHLVGHLLQGAIFQALAPVMPDRVQADSGTPLWSVLLRGVDPARDESFSTILFFNGGMGAMRDRDGIAATSFPGNISNTPIEVAESLAPILFTAKRLDEGSGGDGTRRGGQGQVVAFVSRWPGIIRVSLLTERVRMPAKGLLGGAAGRTGYVHRNGIPVEQAKGMVDLRTGDLLELRLPGGGGFGAPR